MSFIAVPNELFSYHIEQIDHKKVITRKYPLSPSAVRVYIYLLSCRFQDGKIIVKYKTIAHKCKFGSSKRAVSAVRELEAAGLVLKRNRADAHNQKTTNEYTVMKLGGTFFRLDKKLLGENMNSGAYVVYLCLMMHANHCNNTYPSASRISAETGLSEVSVRRKTRYLSERLYITIARLKTKYGDYGNNNYSILTIKERSRIYGRYRSILKKIKPRIKQLLQYKHMCHMTSGRSARRYFFVSKRCPSVTCSFCHLKGGLKTEHQFLYPPRLRYSTKRKRAQKDIQWPKRLLIFGCYVVLP